VEELNARGDRMRDKITEVFFEMGIYAQEHANCLKDVIEVDSFEGNTRLYTGNDEIIHFRL
jgi:hypothetical protein